MNAKIVGILTDHGVKGLAWRLSSYAYKHWIRPALPATSPILYSGIAIGYRRVGDDFLAKMYKPPNLGDIPDYEQALIVALKTYVRKGDKVVIAGGGVGVTATIAAQLVEAKGSVICFEGDRAAIAQIREVADRHYVGLRLRLENAIVGADIDVWGDSKATRIVSAEELPVCDVLELDCEGAELDLLKKMTIRPRVIAVETHGFLQAPTDSVEKALQDIGYEVNRMGLAEPREAAHCQAMDIQVLVGERKSERLRAG